MQNKEENKEEEIMADRINSTPALAERIRHLEIQVKTLLTEVAKLKEKAGKK